MLDPKEIYQYFEGSPQVVIERLDYGAGTRILSNFLEVNGSTSIQS